MLSQPLPSAAPLPLIGVSACRKVTGPATSHCVGDKYVDAVIEAAHGLPLLIPAVGSAIDVEALLDRLDGVLLTGSPSNLDPELYGGGPRPAGDSTDSHRDATTLPLIRACIVRGTPLLALCRGLQEVNVAMGGSLFGRLHEAPGRADHRSDKTLSYALRYGPSHPVSLTAGGLLANLYDGAETIEVNSLHGQGIDRLAPGLAALATAPDGTIEAVGMPGARGFVLAVQWHPEWRAAATQTHRRLFAAFGDACRTHLQTRGSHERSRAMA
jgi:putative glutamine amidotransferase